MRLIALLSLLSISILANAYDADEPQRFGKTNERASEYNTPEFRALMTQVTTSEDIRLATIKLTDPERNSNGSLCQQHRDGCLGDPRFYGWGEQGFGTRQEVVFTSRNGATISAHIWATNPSAGPRPAILINSGSVQAPEEVWGWAGAVLAQRGYVVMTWDPQGQGYSDTNGACSDDFPDLVPSCADREDGVPAQSNDTQPFFLGSQDALDFLLSTPDAPYVPRDSRNGMNHAGKQDRRVAAGFNAAFNPLWALVDPTRIGVAGNSKGAGSATQLAMFDERIDAIVGWDNLSGARSAEESKFGVALNPRVPAMGISNDYGLDVVPHDSRPEPESRNSGYQEHVDANVDAMQINIRSGTHFASAYIPNNKFGATLHGMDLTAWYTAAWMDKYVKGENVAAADAMLTSDRWLCDPRSAALEADMGNAVGGVPDANLLSLDLISKANFELGNGNRFICDDMRGGCDGQLVPDGLPGPYSYLDEAFAQAPADSRAFPACSLLGFVTRLSTQTLDLNSGEPANIDFALGNSSGEDQLLRSLSFSVDNASEFDELRLFNGAQLLGSSAFVANMTVTLNTPQEIPAGDQLRLRVELRQTEPVAASMALNPAVAADNRQDLPLLPWLVLALLLLAVPRRWWWLSVLIFASCGEQSPADNSASEASVAPRNLQLSVTAVDARNGNDEAVQYRALPTVLADISIR